MNVTNVMSATRAAVKAPREASEAQARTRERASAIFPAAGPPPPPPPPPPAAGEGPPGGRLTAVRTWLLLRCGLELRTAAALTAVLLAATGLAVRHYVTGRPHTVRVAAAVPPVVPTPGPSPARPALTVDIAGKVARPGLRRLPPGSRVADALAAAGGPLPGADTTSLNLARPLADGEQLVVGRPQPPPSAATPGSPATPLSLNSATVPQLDALPGVGPVLAQHILDYRTQHGAFTSLQQLRQVPGIGDRKFATLKPLVQP
ncbi:helix-hairpin-helix domain-containing protein [Streptomyces sp. NPDC020983]|uniref:helix-hairpin-helix domain-containing protein n=1 Tax=Streptomyces sp. NPDC020983 TaxID=3365106 RepID=UPI00379E731F